MTVLTKAMMIVFIVAWSVMVAAWFYSVRNWNGPSKDECRKAIVGLVVMVGQLDLALWRR